MSDASEGNSVHRLLHINGALPTPEVQEALREVQRLVSEANTHSQALSAASHTTTSPLADPPLTEALAILAQLAPLRVQMQVQPSSLPIVGGLLTRLKVMLHQLMLFYVNDLAAQQSAFNHQLLNVLQRMANQPVRR